MDTRKLQKRLLKEELRRRRKTSRARRLLIGGGLLGLLLLFAGTAFYLYNQDRKGAGDYRRALARLEKGDYQGAATAFRAVYDRHPDSDLAPQALFEAGEVQSLYLQRYPEALLAFLLVEKDYPGSAPARRARRRIAELYKYRLRDYAEAVVAYQKLLDAGVSDGDAVQYEIADAYFRLNNFEQARIEFESFLKGWPESPRVPEVRYRIATAQALEGDLAGAEETLRGVIADFPGDPFALEARFALAGVLEEQERLRAALQLLEELRGAYPKPDALERRLEQVRERIQKKKQAI